MNLDFQAGGSPLAARMNPIIYTVILVGLVIIAIFFGVWFLLNLKKKKEESPEWIEAQKTRPTIKKDVTVFSQKYSLRPEEEAFLWKICRRYEIQNINYSVKELYNITPYFQQYYNENKNLPDTELNALYKVRFRLERIFASFFRVSSTKALTAGQKINEIFPDGSKARYSVLYNHEDFLAIAVPKEVFESDTKPENLEKVAFSFTTDEGMSYAFVSRVMRYEKNEKNGETKYSMLVSHSTDLIEKQQRSFKRIHVNEKCRIASVKTETDRKGNKIYVPTDQKFDCMLTNISGGGCCISTTLPVKEGQLSYVALNLPEGETGVIGKIIRTRKSKTQGLYNLHIQFINISLKVQNKILAKVYGYN